MEGNFLGRGLSRIAGQAVVISEALTKTEFRPYQLDRFVEYEPKDEGWMTMLGMGRRVEVISDAYEVGGTIYMSPKTWLVVQEQLAKEDR